MRKTSELIWQDAQHQALFEILDLINVPGSDREVVRRLEDYTENHFAIEERYMELLGFPGREEHIEAHDRFRKEIGELVRREGEFDDVFREIVATFLTQWLTRHVFGIDKKLEDFILASDAK